MYRCCGMIVGMAILAVVSSLAAGPAEVTNWHLTALQGITVGPSTNVNPGTLRYTNGVPQMCMAGGAYERLLTQSNYLAATTLILDSPRIRLGDSTGTEEWGVFGDSWPYASSINVGGNLGIRTNSGWANVNFGLVAVLDEYTKGVQACDLYAMGSGNFGYVSQYGRQKIGGPDSYSIGSFNFGSVSGLQCVEASCGSFNLGYLNCLASDAGQHIYGTYGGMNFGFVAGTSYQIVYSGHGSVNMGYLNTGSQTNRGYGCMNFGFLGSGGRQTVLDGSPDTGSHGSMNFGCSVGGYQLLERARGSWNAGFVYDGGWQSLSNSAGCFNFGYLENNSLQEMRVEGDTVAGNMNLGYVTDGATQRISGAGSLNVGDVEGGDALQWNAGYGSVNIGALTHPGFFTNSGVQIMTGYGSLNVGRLAAFSFQTNTANGAMALGRNNTQGHNYSLVVGDGVNSMETNSVAARKYHATQGYAVSGVSGLLYSHSWVDAAGITSLVCYAGGIVTNLFTNGVSVIP